VDLGVAEELGGLHRRLAVAVGDAGIGSPRQAGASPRAGRHSPRRRGAECCRRALVIGITERSCLSARVMRFIVPQERDDCIANSSRSRPTGSGLGPGVRARGARETSTSRS
jgi:hypothetical protein